MPHVVREIHLDDICANCKQLHGNHIEILPYNHKLYRVIKCEHCGYEMIRLIEETPINDRLSFI